MADADCFLKIDGIEGESLDNDHAGEIEVLSWSWGASQPGSMAYGSGGGAGKVNMQDFSFSMRNGKASPNIMLACASGKHIKSAKLTCRKAGGEQEEYLTFTLSDCLISSYQTGGSGGGDVPIESVSINFAKVEMQYKPQGSDGSLGSLVKTGWDLKTNKKV
jgi:type VI secretion system secreted protein Hcp